MPVLLGCQRIENVVLASKDLDNTTDNLYSLFYNSNEIKKELERRIEK